MPNYPIKYEQFIKSHPNIFYGPLRYMSQVLRDLELKTIQWLPSRTTHTPCHITIDTAVMLSFLYHGDDRRDLLKQMSSQQARDVWFKLFSFKKFRGVHEDQEFANSISTDGVSISIAYTSKEVQRAKDNNSIVRKAGRAAHMELIKNKTNEEKDAFRATKAQSQQDQKRQKLSADHEKRVAYAASAPPQRRRVDGIPYAADMTPAERAETDGHRFVGIDPGRRDLLYMIGDADTDGKRLNFTYSNRQHVHESGRVRLTKG
jgi:hypothetical protein